VTTINPITYTICDLQPGDTTDKPGDTIVATYSTRGVLDLSMTVSRKDGSASKAEWSRIDYNNNKRINVRNAVTRARSGR